jgi:peroxiredoxin Q/BCP
MRVRRIGLAAGGLAAAGFLAAQAVQGGTPLQVGAVAPDFTLASATSSGTGKPVRLSDFKGQTVVLAFFYKARTGG